MQTSLSANIQSLPIELQAEILASVAWRSKKREQLQLMLLGKRAYSRVDKVFYHTIFIFDTSYTPAQSNRTIGSVRRLFTSKPTGYFADRTRALYFVLVGTEAVAKVLKNYILPALQSSLQHLVIHGSTTGMPFPDDLTSVLDSPLKSWIVDPSFHATSLQNLCSHPLDTRCLALDTLTHVTLALIGDGVWQGLRQFRKLTHIFVHSITWALLEMEVEFLEQCCAMPSVRIVALAVMDPSTPLSAETRKLWSEKKFMKIVIIPPPPAESQEWTNFIEGRVTVWNKAEDILLKAQSAGE
ncbi:hypothetical protein DL96DRAFT_1585660 [Flagelloscypha sp. PMI_526]|nr:hypothetical protein DL96DRAFT_1585660 [Flagelloscypha sp. PMI_526]